MAWSAPVTIAEPASEPVTLPEAKEFLSIEADETEFDALIGAFIGAAREQIEAVTCTGEIILLGYDKPSRATGSVNDATLTGRVRAYAEGALTAPPVAP